MSHYKPHRRDALMGAAAAVTGSAIAGRAAAKSRAPVSGETPEQKAAPYKNPELINHMYGAPKLINEARARAIMDKYGLDGLVASVPHNIQYISSHSGIMQWMGRSFSTYAFYPRRADAEAALILPGTMLYHLDYRPTWIRNIKVVSFARRNPAGEMVLKENGDPDAVVQVGIWPIREGAEMKRGDLIQLAMFAEFEGKTSPSALYALKQAILEGAGAKSRIGFDDPRVGAWLQDIGTPDLKVADAANVFKEIRMVKTPAEVSLLREAARRNEAALDYAIEQITPGLPLEEIEWAHARKWSTLYGHSKWLIANVRGVNSGQVAKGDFMKLDSVGTFKGYHGDVGRTVMVGEPTDELARRIEADTKNSRKVYDVIKPGMKYTEASKMFSDLMRQDGFEIAFAAPHDVGLEHTDHPVDTGNDKAPGSVPFGDFTFQDGTVFTLDMPHNEMGWGTTHVEDMIYVTGRGYEFLSSGNTDLRLRPA